MQWFGLCFSRLEAALSGQLASLVPLPSPMGVCPAAKRALPGKYISYCTVWEGHDLGNCRSPSLTPALLPPSNLLRTRPGSGRGKPARQRAAESAGPGGVCVQRAERGQRHRVQWSSNATPPDRGFHWIGLPPTPVHPWFVPPPPPQLPCRGRLQAKSRFLLSSE